LIREVEEFKNFEAQNIPYSNGLSSRRVLEIKNYQDKGQIPLYIGILIPEFNPLKTYIT
jgi:hypothetical protein